MVHMLSCSSTCETFPDQGLNLCLLHWQVGSSPLNHQGSPCHSPFEHLSGILGDSWVVQLVKDPPAMQKTPGQFLSQEDALEKE